MASKIRKKTSIVTRPESEGATTPVPAMVAPRWDGAAVSDDELSVLRSQLEAIGKAQAIPEFSLDGTVLTANDNFLSVVGYSLSEVQGQHHRMFVESAFAESEEYRQFWEGLAGGEFHAAEYKRIGRNGRELWIQATYTPVFDGNGKPYKIVKLGIDVTEQRMYADDYRVPFWLSARSTPSSNLASTARL